ncbi:uncharacterized protein LOC126678354 [Mercurialis annua]|uniref:uncharacterized protein LOC126678354 n=1 Tax=Mercurialis annua TaxID=3986 RepID=UPI00216001E9|nr:uncharacterized protein LOC126678354 [Mercurialis annua]
MLWSPGYVPKHSFIAWLAVQNKLRIKDKLKAWGSIDNDICGLCNVAVETIDHIFFECSVSLMVMQRVLQNCNINRNVLSWRREVAWFSRKTMGKSVLARVRRIAFVSSIYNIWRGRNRKIFEEVDVTGEEIFRWVRQDVLLKLLARNGESVALHQMQENWK